MRATITANRLGLIMPASSSCEPGRGTYHIRELTDRYAIAAPSASSPPDACVIFCRTCEQISDGPADVRERYCAHCCTFHAGVPEIPDNLFAFASKGGDRK